MAKNNTYLTKEQRKQPYELYQTGEYLNHDLADRFGIKSKSIHLIIRAYKKGDNSI